MSVSEPYVMHTLKCIKPVLTWTSLCWYCSWARLGKPKKRNWAVNSLSCREQVTEIEVRLSRISRSLEWKLHQQVHCSVCLSCRLCCVFMFIVCKHCEV